MGPMRLFSFFCDTEKKPYEQYEDIKRKISDFHGVDNAADEVIIFGNPCTMQIVSKHWTDEIIKRPAKATNAPLIEKYTGVKGYKGRADQIDQVMESISADNYYDMKERICAMSQDDHAEVSSNFGKLLEKLETEDVQWMNRINDNIDGIL